MYDILAKYLLLLVFSQSELMEVNIITETQFLESQEGMLFLNQVTVEHKNSHNDYFTGQGKDNLSELLVSFP